VLKEVDEDKRRKKAKLKKDAEGGGVKLRQEYYTHLFSAVLCTDDVEAKKVGECFRGSTFTSFLRAVLEGYAGSREKQKM